MCTNHLPRLLLIAVLQALNNAVEQPAGTEDALVKGLLEETEQLQGGTQDTTGKSPGRNVRDDFHWRFSSGPNRPKLGGIPSLHLLCGDI